MDDVYLGGIVSIAVFCFRFTPESSFLLRRFVFGSRLLFDAQCQTGRLAGGCVSIPPWVGIALVHSQMLYGYRALLVYFRIVRCFMAIPTGFPDEAPPEAPKKSRRRSESLLGGRMSLEQKLYHCAVTRKADDCTAIESQADHVPLAQ